MFPVNLMGFQNLLQLAQQLLHTEDNSQLEKIRENSNTDLVIIGFYTFYEFWCFTVLKNRIFFFLMSASVVIMCNLIRFKKIHK